VPFRHGTAEASGQLLLTGESAALVTASAELSHAGYDVRLERSGDAGLAALDAAPFDLLIVDWLLPGGDAESLCEAIRARPRHAELHIIVLAPAGGSGAEQSLQVGADDYLATPFGQAALLARVRAGVRSARLHSSEAQLRTLVANAPGAIYRCANDLHWTMELISDDIERISGYPASDFIRSAARTFASIIHPDDRKQVEVVTEQGTRAGRLYALEYRIMRADGSLAWVLERGQEVHAHDGRSWLEGVIFDVTDRKRVEDDLHESMGRLAVVEDRERIARELHDGVIQSLFGVGITLQALRASADRPAEVDASLAASVDRINSVIDDVRHYILGLRPSLLADHQLHEALDELARDFHDSSGIVAAVDADPVLTARLAPQAEHIVQMAREALSNVGRHAHASTCRISLRLANGKALLEIDDDGCGFDPAAAAGGTGQGLRNLAERSQGLGGRLAIHSDGAGTTVSIWMPLAVDRPGTAASEISGGLGPAGDFKLSEDA
jgi:PAS domain S-box-containing protein